MRQTGLRNGGSGNTTLSFLFLIFDKQKKKKNSLKLSHFSYHPRAPPFLSFRQYQQPPPLPSSFASSLYSLFSNLEESQPPNAFSSVLSFLNYRTNPLIFLPSPLFCTHSRHSLCYSLLFFVSALPPSSPKSRNGPPLSLIFLCYL